MCNAKRHTDFVNKSRKRECYGLNKTKHVGVDYKSDRLFKCWHPLGCIFYRLLRLQNIQYIFRCSLSMVPLSFDSWFGWWLWLFHPRSAYCINIFVNQHLIHHNQDWMIGCMHIFKFSLHYAGWDLIRGPSGLWIQKHPLYHWVSSLLTKW